MKTAAVNNFLNFRGATININALSDVHGNLNLADRGCQTLLNSDVFEKEEKGKANFLIIGGDWFISGGKKGFLTSPDTPLMEFQLKMYNKFMDTIKNKFPKTKDYLIAGNHEFDGGAEIFKNAIDKIDSTVIISNLDFKNSPKLTKLCNDKKIVSSAVDFVEDDKNPNVKHPVLNLGAAPFNMEFFAGKLDGISMLDDSTKSQIELTAEDYGNSKKFIRKQIDDFKNKYPNGVVVLTCHTGAGFADECASSGGIDIIFDGHEHKDEIRKVNGTPIIALSQNFNKIANAKITLDDNSKIKNIKIKEIRPFEQNYLIGELDEYYNRLFYKDNKKKYTIECKDKNILELSPDNIRNSNNNLANFVTDSILQEIQQIDDTIQIFALNASSIRGGFKISDKPEISPFEVSNCLIGINYNAADILVNELKGDELIYLILDNFLTNEKNPERNPLIHYSGIKTDKTGMLKAYKNNETNLCKYVTLQKSGKPISPDETYKIANPEKYFMKTKNPDIKALNQKSYSLGFYVHDLFREHFEKNPHQVITPDNRLY